MDESNHNEWVRQLAEMAVKNKFNERERNLLVSTTPELRNYYGKSFLEGIGSSGTRPSLVMIDDIEDKQTKGEKKMSTQQYKLIEEDNIETLNERVNHYLDRGFKIQGLPYSLIVPMFDSKCFQNGSISYHYQAVFKKGDNE